MALYINSSGRLTPVNEKKFQLEKDIQKLFEDNLQLIMGLVLVKSECTIKNRRIDTLAFDPQTKGFIIIEYKRDRNISVVDQGFTYLSLMLENKADFIVEYNERLQRNLQRSDVDWSQTRVVFVSTSFTENQKQATNFRDIAIELWEVSQYENNTISIEPIRKSSSAESIQPLARQDSTIRAVAEEIKVFTEDDHLANTSPFLSEVYTKFKQAILNLADDIEIRPVKTYIAFKLRSNICDIEVRRQTLKIYINLRKGQLDDSKKLTRDISEVGHAGNGDYMVQVKDTKNLEYIMSLVKQAIKP